MGDFTSAFPHWSAYDSVSYWMPKFTKDMAKTVTFGGFAPFQAKKGLWPMKQRTAATWDNVRESRRTMVSKKPPSSLFVLSHVEGINRMACWLGGIRTHGDHEEITCDSGSCKLCSAKWLRSTWAKHCFFAQKSGKNRKGDSPLPTSCYCLLIFNCFANTQRISQISLTYLRRYLVAVESGGLKRRNGGDMPLVCHEKKTLTFHCTGCLIGILITYNDL